MGDSTGLRLATAGVDVGGVIVFAVAFGKFCSHKFSNLMSKSGMKLSKPLFGSLRKLNAELITPLLELIFTCDTGSFNLKSPTVVVLLLLALNTGDCVRVEVKLLLMQSFVRACSC